MILSKLTINGGDKRLIVKANSETEDSCFNHNNREAICSALLYTLLKRLVKKGQTDCHFMY